MWITFTRPWLWEPRYFKGAVAIQFKTGMTFMAVREAAKLALEKDVARKATDDEVRSVRGLVKAKA